MLTVGTTLKLKVISNKLENVWINTVGMSSFLKFENYYKIHRNRRRGIS